MYTAQIAIYLILKPQETESSNFNMVARCVEEDADREKMLQEARKITDNIFLIENTQKIAQVF